MKKLELKQMEKVNGGEWSRSRCGRVLSRAGKNAVDNPDRFWALMEKYAENC